MTERQNLQPELQRAGPILTDSSDTDHRDAKESDSSGQRRNDKVDGCIGAESAGEGHEQVEETDQTFDAEHHWRDLQSISISLTLRNRS